MESRIELYDTIAAIATPVGEGGLSVIRISGPAAVAIADRVFHPAPFQENHLQKSASHTAHYGTIRLRTEILDEVLVTLFRAPRTFTREDTVEISCHGGIWVTQNVLSAVLACGARLARPGEFTQRAFLNGRIDLTQAEAIADLIRARTALATRAAQQQLNGSLSKKIEALRVELMGVLAHIEAHIDFPDEDIAPETRSRLQARLDHAEVALRLLIETAPNGQLIRNGIRLAIVGRPNAGKSSLLNRLLGHERAIVSPIPGTTRDTIEEPASLDGFPIILVDTAGVRNSGDLVEQEGIRRSRASAAAADVILHVVDSNGRWSSDDDDLHSLCLSKPYLVVLNKADLPKRIQLPPDLDAFPVSCIDGHGLETLRDALVKKVWSGSLPNSGSDELAFINRRHEEALRRAGSSLTLATKALSLGESLEFVSIDLRIALQAVGEVVGKVSTDDLLDTIFRQFCLGK